jgi:hypothetical protein
MKYTVIIIPSCDQMVLKIEKEIKDIKSPLLSIAIRKIGRLAGNDLYHYFVKGVRGNKNRIKRSIETLNLTDYGKYRIKRVSTNIIIVKVTESPLINLCSKAKSHQWLCYWIDGFLSGVFFGSRSKWAFNIKECKNSKNFYCEFVGKKR